MNKLVRCGGSSIPHDLHPRATRRRELHHPNQGGRRWNNPVADAHFAKIATPSGFPRTSSGDNSLFRFLHPTCAFLPYSRAAEGVKLSPSLPTYAFCVCLIVTEYFVVCAEVSMA